MSINVNGAAFSEEQKKQSETNNSKSKDENAKRIRYKKVPADGGWGWLVVLGTVTINLLISGFMKAFGVLFSELLEEFHSTTFAASYIPALSYFLHCSLGPVATYLTTKYSYRSVTLVGAICVSLGMILSVFATSIVHLYLTYGILVGVGGSLTLPIGIYIVNSYFVRYKGLASGIAVSGSVIGSIIIPTFLSYLLDVYKVRGTMLIMGGIMLNTIVGALLYHPAEWHMKKVPITDDDDEDYDTNSSDDRRRSNDNDKIDNRTKVEKNTVVSDDRVPSPVRPFNNRSLTTVGVKWLKLPRRATKWCCRQLTVGLFNVINLPLQQPLFLLLLLSNVMASISYANLLIILPVHTVGRDLNKLMASYLLSIIAGFDFIGRVTGSTISDWLPYNKMYYYIAGVMMAGFTLVLFPFANTYVSLCVFSGVFGLSAGTHIGAVLVTLIEILGEDKLKSSLSVLFFVKGVVHLIGMPICGFVYERSKSHVVIVTGLGYLLIVTGTVWIIASARMPPRKAAAKKRRCKSVEAETVKK